MDKKVDTDPMTPLARFQTQRLPAREGAPNGHVHTEPFAQLTPGQVANEPSAAPTSNPVSVPPPRPVSGKRVDTDPLPAPPAMPVHDTLTAFPFATTAPCDPPVDPAAAGRGVPASGNIPDPAPSAPSAESPPSGVPRARPKLSAAENAALLRDMTVGMGFDVGRSEPAPSEHIHYLAPRPPPASAPPVVREPAVQVRRSVMEPIKTLPPNPSSEAPKAIRSAVTVITRQPSKRVLFLRRAGVVLASAIVLLGLLAALFSAFPSSSASTRAAASVAVPPSAITTGENVARATPAPTPSALSPSANTAPLAEAPATEPSSAPTPPPPPQVRAMEPRVPAAKPMRVPTHPQMPTAQPSATPASSKPPVQFSDLYGQEQVH